MRRMWIGVALVGALGAAACRPPVEPAPVRTAAPPTMPTHEQLVERLSEPGVTTPLDEVARAAARGASVDFVIPARALRDAMAERLGSGTWPHVLSAHGSDETIARLLAPALAELQATTAISEIGTATASGPVGRVGILVALPAPHLAHTVSRGELPPGVAGPAPDPAVVRVTVDVDEQLRDEIEVFAVSPTRSVRLSAVAEGASQIAVTVDCRRRAGDALELHARSRVVATIVDACTPIAAAAVATPTEEVGPPARTRIEIEQRVFELINRERLAHGLRALAWDADGQRFARAHSEDMLRGRYVSHAGPDGATYEQRIAAARLLGSPTHENVGHAWGPAEVHVAFMGSPGHKKNLLADDVEHGSVGIVFDTDDTRDPGAFYITEFFRTVK